MILFEHKRFEDSLVIRNVIGWFHIAVLAINIVLNLAAVVFDSGTGLIESG